MQRHLIFIFLAVVFNVAANFTLKAFVASRNPSFIDQLRSIPFYLAIMFFGVNFLFYAKALQSITISTAYPMVVGLSIVLLTVLSLVFLHERLTALQLGGIAVIILGIVMVFK